ncbi:MAG TPA: hypothetical protein VGR14_20340 [Verrucomicrobiae bacterium]|jgi:hypothetical protein|nr:hypothetical protein [Verrucomicrobiae bacterium]
MKVARTVLAPLLALALLMSQSAFFAEAMPLAKASNCGCHKAVCCCQTPANPQSTPRPVAPARTVTQNDLQIIAAVVEHISSSAAPSRLSVPRHQASLEAAPVPLYQRDCALLI